MIRHLRREQQGSQDHRNVRGCEVATESKHGAGRFARSMCSLSRSVVVAPEAQHFHQLLIFLDAVDESMLDVDSPGIGAL